MTLPWKLSVFLIHCYYAAGESMLYGPVFIQEPQDIIFPVETDVNQVILNCEATGNPAPQFRWQLNSTDLDVKSDYRYSLIGGNLQIKNPDKDLDAGIYQCVASNTAGTVISSEAKLQFAYLENFKTKSRRTVSVREGQGVVLLCGPPPHAGDLTYAWIFNEYPSFVQQDSRRFVSQETGHLYIAKVEASDVGNYTCVVTNTVINSRVLGSPTPLVLRNDGVMGEYEPKIEVQFPETVPAAKGSTLKLECFALGNPVPVINWRRADGVPFPSKIKVKKSNGLLEIPHFQQEDAGVYECIAENPRGKNVARGRLTYYAPPHWVQRIRDIQAAIEDSLFWECRASGKPKPSYRWLKNGEALALEERIHIQNGALTITSLTLSDSGMYQCVAENRHGIIYSSGELRVTASAPDFSKTPLKKLLQVQIGSLVIFECAPKASPRASCSWKKGNEILQENERVSFLEDCGLRIINVTKSDGGSYTCIARNQFGTASSSGSLVATDPTQIMIAPSAMDVTVGESIVLPCQVYYDPHLFPTFTWYFNGQPIDFEQEGSYFEKVGGIASGDLMIRNIQLKHAGQYVCVVQTSVDSVSAAGDVIVRGPPGPPRSVRVDEITETTAQLSWQPGSDNHSPVTNYVVQARTPFSVGWQAVATVPEIINGRTLTATVVDLNPWVDYEFRVVASNKIGVGEPSSSSGKARTEEAVPETPPAEVSGGGGKRHELVITWEPVPEELQNGEGFGYVVAFRLLGMPWMHTVIPSPDASKYVFRNESVQPFSPFEVKVGVYNNKGEGPFSSITTVNSAEEEPSLAPGNVSVKSMSASEIKVTWDPVLQKINRGTVLGYEVRYWKADEKDDTASSKKVKGIEKSLKIDGLKSNSLYYVTVAAFNTAGMGPSSTPVNTTTKKPPPSQPPRNIICSLNTSGVFLSWDQVNTMENESEVTGYKVLYMGNRHNGMNEMSTNSTSLELPLPSSDGYIIEVRAISEGGEGNSSEQIIIPRVTSMDARGSFASGLDIYLLSLIIPIILLFLAS